MKKCLLIILTFYNIGLFAQQTDKDSQPWDIYLEQLNGQEEFESTEWEPYYELLADMAEHPLNINTIKKEDLELMPFLSAQQIEDIMAYLYQYGEMKSFGELAMIKSLGYEQQQLLRYFTTIEETTTDKDKFPSWKNIWKYGKHEVIATAKIPFYERKGDQNGYLGYKYKHWIKYDFSYSKYLKFGFLGSQDAGEPFLAGRNNLGYDYYTFWLQIKNLGPIKNLTLGRYRLGFGMGLVMNSNFGFGKTATLSSLGRNTNRISAHSSRYSGNYLQGIAATVALNKHIDLTGFFSYRLIDATLNSGSQSIATIVKTGYHRTATEMNKKNDAWQAVTGGNVKWSNNGFHVGATGIYSTFDKPLIPKKTQAYKKWYAEGQNFFNVSVDYGYTSNRLNVCGETATGNCGAIATINSISYMLTQSFTAVAVQRYYSYKYYSLFSNSFSEGSGVQDENGIYLGLTWTPTKLLSLKGYTDYTFFQWPQYLHTQSHKAWDNLIDARLQLKKWSLSARYRLHMKDVEFKSSKTNKVVAIGFEPEHRARMALNYSGRILTNKAQIDCCYSQLKGQSFGWMLSENISYAKKWVHAALNFGYFHTQDYYSRVYAYEQGTLYNMSFPMFYGHGIRYCINLRGDIGKHWMIISKLGITDYFDRDHISSSYQQINKSSQADLDIQIRWKF